MLRRVASKLFNYGKSKGKDPRLELLKKMPQHSVCAEIGVHVGDFANHILEQVQPKKLHLIDPWKYFEEDVYKDSYYGGPSVSQQLMDERYTYTKERFKNEIANGTVVIHRDFSDAASVLFPEKYFDWIYIDGNHLYEYVKKDLSLYYPKIKPGGFFTGDDYGEGSWWRNGVKKAVMEAIKQGGVEKVSIKDGQFILRKK